jgi:dTDP-4-amino-4,6-dideoxygalactose transaminase
MIQVLQNDPKQSYLAQKDEINAAIASVLENGFYILGKEVAGFEEDFSRFVGIKKCVGVASGTDAVEIALRASGIRTGDGVITVSNTAVATVVAIELCGAVPVLVDVDVDTFNIDAEQIEETVNSHPAGFIKAIVAVHLFGHSAEMDTIMAVAAHNNLTVIEDCAQAHGAMYHGHPVGSIGAAGAFSFYPTKNLGALGDGGCIVTNDMAMAERIVMLRQYGWRERFISNIPGMNSRLDELQAAILRVKLKQLEQGNQRRREIAAFYCNSLVDTPLILPKERQGCRHVYHQFVIRCPERDSLQSYLQDRSIGTSVLYPVPIHQQAGYAGRLPISPAGLNRAEALSREILSLPMYPELNEQQLGKVVDAIRGWCRAR